jgi:anthranilate phosphoribosyltransferase
MSDAIHNAISILLKQSSLSENEMHAAVLQVMDGNASGIGLCMLLTALRLKGETVDEIVGAARALRERAIRIPTSRPGILDTCGTGGDELSTFNISTATAIVTAACGVPVAKHSNRGFTSKSGSADVLEALGVRIDLTPEQVARAINEIGIGFCFAPVAHGAMKYAAPVRKQLGFRTVFNMLGPLTNPAGAEFQLVGAGKIAIAEKLGEALVRLGTSRALVVCGNDELDEVSLWGRTTILRVEHGETARFAWTAEDLGLEECSVSDLRASSIAESAETIRNLLCGEKGPARNIVLANAAAALFVAQNYRDPREAVAAAASAIDSGRARATWEQLTHFAAKGD